jgi:uncharacterized SAM-binding protein YcdF (DUF218 family)
MPKPLHAQLAAEGSRPDGTRCPRLIVVHGHREGGAAAGRGLISLECVARVRRAERLARLDERGAALFCGAGAPGHPSEARQMAAHWRGRTVRKLLDEHSRDTPGNVNEAIRWAQTLGCDSLVVVSSWWHLRLRLYYRRRCPRDIAVRHARSWRCRRLVQRLANELRYLPRVWT